MFVPLWVIFLLSGLIISVFTVVWGVHSRQFDDQNRARFIPLIGLEQSELNRQPSRKRRAEYIGVCTVLAMGLVAIGAGLLLALKHL